MEIKELLLVKVYPFTLRADPILEGLNPSGKQTQKSQKLSQFLNMAEKHGGVSIHHNILLEFRN